MPKEDQSSLLQVAETMGKELTQGKDAWFLKYLQERADK